MNVEERLQEIAPFVSAQPQSEQGRLCEMLADLTDDDGGIAEMDAMGL